MMTRARRRPSSSSKVSLVSKFITFITDRVNKTWTTPHARPSLSKRSGRRKKKRKRRSRRRKRRKRKRRKIGNEMRTKSGIIAHQRPTILSIDPRLPVRRAFSLQKGLT